jgi:hypothetical protein
MRPLRLRATTATIAALLLFGLIGGVAHGADPAWLTDFVPEDPPPTALEGTLTE